jgi:hypothetical protein
MRIGEGKSNNDQKISQEEEHAIDKGHSSRPAGSGVNESTTGVFPFLPDHPLATSHGTQCHSLVKEQVPNFVRPTLPRPDQGDCEFYCSTMLTFFKPWRSGLELKRENQSWDDMFDAHVFSDRHREIMRNMNIRYECLDVHDDFRAQLNKSDSGVSYWENEYGDIIQDINEMRTINSETLGCDESKSGEEICDISYITGKQEKT